MTATRFHTRSLIALLAVGSLGIAACGSDDDDAVSEQLPPASADSDDGVSEPDEPAGDSEIVLGEANTGGTIVDPKPHPIDGIEVAESFPEQLMVRFTAGDPSCLAATAIATASGSNVIVTLDVGITEDALTKSCVPGDVEHMMTIVLDEGRDGREVLAAQL